MAMTVMSVVLTVLLFLEIGVLACSTLGTRQRSRFPLRLAVANVAMSVLALGLAFSVEVGALSDAGFGRLWMVLLLASLTVAPLFCYRPFAASDAGGADDSGPGGPGGPGSPSHRPNSPSGGIPLPDADQAQARRRDHRRPGLGGSGRRRPADTPSRSPVPAGPHRAQVSTPAGRPSPAPSTP